MSQVINTNVMSLNAQRNLSTSGGSLATALQRLSSGLRINSAKDDAAGLAISERLTTQIRGLNQAARNASDGISMSQTAEGGLSTVGDLLQRMRELAVQAANSTNSASDRQSLQREVSQLQQEVARISTTTNFNGQKLLDGSLTGAQFQVGANAAQTIQISIGSVKGTDIGNFRLRTDGDNANATTAGATRVVNSVLTTEVLTIAGNGTSVSVTPGAAGESAKAIADRVNSAVSAAGQSTGVTAFAQTKATLSGASAGTVSFNLYGQNSTAIAISATVTASDVSALATAVNSQSASTGITASANGATLTFTSADGYDVAIENFANTGGGTASLAGFNPFTDAAAGAAVTLTSGAATDSSTVGGLIQFNASSGYTVTSAVAGALFGATTANASSLTAVSAIDISTVSGANDAIRIVDSALTSVNNLRADLGAVQNRFTQTINSLQTASENLSAARSRILDADFASETAALTRAQILQQAGVAILSQANAVPQNVLSLLR
jgi:flagellin